MSFRSRTRRLATVVIGGVLTSILFSVVAMARPAAAQDVPVIPPVYPCGSIWVQNECHFYDQVKEQYDNVERSLQFAVVTGLLNAMQFFTQKLAMDSAQWILNGGHGKGTAFYNKTFGDYLKDLGEGAGNLIISDLNHVLENHFKFSLCKPITLNLQLSLGLGSNLAALPTPDCTYQQIQSSFEQTFRALGPDELTDALRKSLNPEGNDIGLAITANNIFLQGIAEHREAGLLDRAEGAGLKPLTDFISGKIQTPTQVAKDTLLETNNAKLLKERTALSTTILAAQALKAGLTQLPVIAASSFLNTLAVGLLQKFFNSLSSVDDEVAKVNLLNPNAQASAERGTRTSNITDILAPNLLSQEKKNFLFELSTCNPTRGLWGCSIDSGFVSALQDATEVGGYTIARASGVGLNDPGSTNGTTFLHPDWELIPEREAKDNKDPGCYQRAYCASNLAKLRFARIISIGWELAANSPFNKKVNGKYVVLRDVINGFNNCNDQGQLDADHPWCHLIDPAWVLTIPQFECRLNGFSDSLLSGGAAIRTQECSDVVSCIERNDKGECIGGYGYCLSEKTVWRFGGDSCSERYVSCRTYKTRDKSKSLTTTALADTATGPEVSYIRNSVDYGSCNAENVGCMVYRNVRDTSVTSSVAWVGGFAVAPDNGNTQDGVDWRKFTGSRVYFDATAEACDKSSAGCTKVYEVRPTQSALNLVKNGSFEDDDETAATKLAGWLNEDYAPANQYVFEDSGSAGAHSGVRGADFPASTAGMYQRIAMAPLRNYVLSAYLREGSDISSGSNASVVIEFERPAFPADPQSSVHTYPDGVKTHQVEGTAEYYQSANCTPVDATPGTQAAGIVKTVSGTELQRFTCEFVSHPDTQFGRVKISGNGFVIDDIQIEEGPAVTPYVNGVNAALTQTHLKLAPEELNCQGLETDHPDCQNYARVCRQIDAGCQGYTGVGSGDTTEIPAILSEGDLCPNSCVGYAEYQKLTSGFDLVKNPTQSFLDDPADQTSAFFIPKQAQQCSAAAVGCEEFTNVESADQGGESKLYATYARACLNPSKAQNEGLTRTYFTWEGSDTTGYQLRTWSLIQKGNDPSPFDPVYAGVPNAPRILRKAGPDGIVKDPALCDENLWNDALDADCRQVYDEQGAVYYRFFSQTIVSSTDCRDYRKNNSDFDDCTKTGGEFNQQTNECIYHILASESAYCSAVDASCRAYIGTTGRNTAMVFEEMFASASGTSFEAGNANTNASYSSESLRVGDFSLRIEDTDGIPGTQSVVRTSFTSATGTLYSVSFWAKSTDATKKTALVHVNGSQLVGSFQLETDWRRYELGPFSAANGTSTSVISWTGMPNISFLDEVRINRLQDLVYVRQGQWTIPAECDRTVEGVPQPQAMLGCRSYVDRKSQQVDVRQFSRLCRYDAISCSAFVDTRDSDDAYAQTFVLPGVKEPNLANPQEKAWDTLYAGTVTTTRPADRYIYVVDEPSAHCDASEASCREFGKPKFNATLGLATDTNAGYESVYLKDDITKYVDGDGELQMLCRPSELFCDRFASQIATPAVVSYFRDPGPHTCSWREKVVLPQTADYPAGEYSGWFQKDVDPPQPCYPRLLSAGNTFLFDYAGSATYEGWVSTCPADQSECSEFRDVNDHTDQAHPNGKPYFFINNQRLDKSTCGGSVDPFGGCVLFRDMNDSRLLYSTKATYGKSHAENDNAVAPIDCVADASNPACQNAGTCQNLAKVSCAGNGCNPEIKGGGYGQFIDTHQGIGCETDAQCSYSDIVSPDGYVVNGTCLKNDSNLVLKVHLDRDCTTWLGCSTGETVYDPSQATYVDLCTDVSVCDENLGTTGKNFCAHYVNRVPTTDLSQQVGKPYKEPVLREGRFLDLLTYTARPTGFNVPDYSGFSIPNHFQEADLESRRVAYELLVNRNGPVRDTFIHDYRLVASTPLRTGTKQQNGPDTLSASNQLLPGESVRYTDPSFADLNLCQHGQTGRIGYYNPTEAPLHCYFAVDTPYSNDVNEVLTGKTQFNPRNITNIQTLFEQLNRPDLDPSLTRAFPNPECRAYPDAQSPFPNSYVTEWDFTKDPPAPKKFVDGYNGVPYCEWGEECSCSYRKASYDGGLNRYFSMFGEAPPAGVCVGGTRNGQSCVPGSILGTAGTAGGSNNNGTPSDTSDDTSLRGSEPGGSKPSDVCDGGVCQAIKTVSIIRGQYGYCLQRDASRSISGSQEFNPCLIWNPTPVLFGANDIYHYQPTAGYLPPQNAGEYYCISSARPPQEFRISATKANDTVDPTGTDSWFPALPGQLTQFYFDEDFVSDGGCVGCIGNDKGGEDPEDIKFIDGVNAEGGQMGAWCEDSDDTIDDGLKSNVGVGAAAAQAVSGDPISGAIIGAVINPDHYVDADAGRWIMTGRGDDKNYAEYFIPFNAKKWTNAIYPGAKVTDSNGDIDNNLILQATTERNFSYFTWQLMLNPNGKGIMGCGATADWAEGVNINDYDDDEQLKQAGEQFDSYFRDNFQSTMTRESENFLHDGSGKLQKVRCLNAESDDGSCFYKYWEIGYRADGQQKFLMETIDSPGRKFDPTSVFFKKSEASKAFFSIRAMFEDTNADDNAQTSDEAGEGNTLGGPFQFVGWWVTASVPGATSERAIYMTLRIGNADTCKQVAQVVAPDTREATAFNDRVWEGGGFSVPLLGYVYSTVNPPFGSAIHTRPIGVDPLFQTRGRIPGTQSKLKPPGFIASGLEYFRAQNYPTANWAWLNNLFARVYRVYRYYDQPVSDNSGFCVTGPNTGAFCPPQAVSGANNIPADPDLARKYCGLVGTCNEHAVDPAEAPGACNSLSGVNAGLPCTGNTSDDVGGYHICHNAPMLYQNGIPTAKYLNCEQATGWSKSQDGKTFFPCSTPGNCPGFGKNDAAARGAFTCAKGSVTTFTGQPLLCGEIAFNSKDCPAMVKGDGNIQSSSAGGPNPDGFIHSKCDVQKGHCMNGFEHAPCTQDSQCQFTAQEYWGSYHADKPWGGVSGTAAKNGYGLFKLAPNHSTMSMDAIVNLTGGDTDAARQIYTAHESSWFEYHDDGDGFAGPYGQGNGANSYMSYAENINDPNYPDNSTIGGRAWWTDQTLIHAGTSYDAGEGDVDRKTDIGGKDLKGGGFIRYSYSAAGDGISYLNRFPGAYAAAVVVSNPDGNNLEIDDYADPEQVLMIPGHCERPPDTSLDDNVNPVSEDTAAGSKSVYRADKNDKPYAETTWFCGGDGDLFDFGNGGDAESNVVGDVDCGGNNEFRNYRRYFGGQGDWIFGLCEGGAKDGAICNQSSDCLPEDLTNAQMNAAQGWCKSPADATYAEECTPDKNNDGIVDFPCDPLSKDLDKDCNLCTHNSGYYPQTNICGNDPLRPQCLTGYNLYGYESSGNVSPFTSLGERLKSVDQGPQHNALPPTDVTEGFYTPNILGAPQTIGELGYVAYYTPRGPTIAAPDTGRSCASPGSCPVSLINTFSLENRSEGKVAYVGGQAIATIRFYGWTPDNQGGLKDMWIDWGDDSRQEFHDAKMKNHKPFCGVGKECQLIPGLTCSTDNDCPPAGGKCVTTGVCSAHPYISCLRNEDCGSTSNGDICVPRTGFGSTDLACEANYFEFTHAFACDQSMKAILPSCQAANNTEIKLCSRDNTKTCNTDSDCRPGDSCLSGLAKPGGCFDNVLNACRFTPRVLVKDNWGWCTGECRVNYLGNGNFSSGAVGDQQIYYKNAGCYDASALYINNRSDQKVIPDTSALQNSCDPDKTAGQSARPWIVYRGALQLGVSTQ